MDTHKNRINIPYAPTDTADLYPETDGKPMAASDFHLEILIQLLQTLKAHFAQMPDVYISGDILTYYIEGTCALSSHRMYSSLTASGKNNAIFTKSGKKGSRQPVDKEWLQTPAEQNAARAENAEARAENAEARAEQETSARQTAEEEIERLREQLARLQART